jgi:UbiD family decarboxylase
VIKVKCITHRRDPLSYGLICRVVEDYPRMLLRSGAFQTQLIHETGLTNLRQAYLPEVGRLGMVVIAAEIRDAEEPKRIMMAAWENGGARWVIVVDEDCDVRNWNDIMWRVCSAAEPGNDIVQGPERRRSRGHRGEVDFDPPLCGLGIDATMRFKEARFPPVNKVSGEAARWKEFGL